ncbi:MAG: hypothetical protein MUF52_08050 [Syntrophobacteraceae bacterium]|jgi:hypothetical protein|nr:hypothetical protein [Syntrophobacteraceae bacterium]
MKIDWKFWADFMRAMAWPGLAALMLLMFRKQIAEVLTQLARRLRRAHPRDVHVDLKRLPELPLSWKVGAADVRLLTPPRVLNGNSRAFFQELVRPAGADYVVVDLGKGQEWLASRLFLFSLILGMARSLRTLVFLESSHGVRRRFLGTASPADVHKALAVRYPWLEEAWLQASAAQYERRATGAVDGEEPASGQPLFSGADPEMVRSFSHDFLERIQRSGPPPEAERDHFLQVSSSPEAWEKTQWLDGERLERDLAGWLQYDWCEHSPDRPHKAIVASVVRRGAPFVALVDSDRRFLGLVDRYALLDETREMAPKA